MASGGWNAYGTEGEKENRVLKKNLDGFSKRGQDLGKEEKEGIERERSRCSNHHSFIYKVSIKKGEERAF